MDLTKLNNYLLKLKKNPPSSIIFEGGTSKLNLTIIKNLAKILNCKRSGCNTCKTCLAIEHLELRDFFILDGAEVKIDDIRELKQTIANIPNIPFRIISFLDANELNLNCTNALLKVLEEPPPKNIFLFFVPQRESLLPTIVSRSFVFTLTVYGQTDFALEDETICLENLKNFIRSGQNLFDLKKKISKKDLKTIICYLQTSLIKAQLKKETTYLPLNTTQLHKLYDILNLAQHSLSSNCSPDLIFTWMMMKLFENWKIDKAKEK
ncbi:MAG: hypothetical protein Q9M37_05735 [Desulfonauticus sp.]|nr:hypothetical protein [Desulfonauticus sp.]